MRISRWRARRCSRTSMSRRRGCTSLSCRLGPRPRVRFPHYPPLHASSFLRKLSRGEIDSFLCYASSASFSGLLETYKPLGATSVSLPLHSNASAFLTFPSINSASAALSTLRSTPSGEAVNFARPIRAFEYLPKAELILTNLQSIPTELLSSALLTASNGLPFELKRESREGSKGLSGWATVKFDTVELAMEVKKALGGMSVGDQRVGVNFPRI